MVNSFFDNFTVSFCDVCSAELLPFQVLLHEEFHVMGGDDAES